MRVFKKIIAIMQLEGNGLSWEYARRTCAACVDKLAGLQLSTPSSPFCQILLTLSCPSQSTDIFRAEEKIMLNLCMRRGMYVCIAGLWF